MVEAFFAHELGSGINRLAKFITTVRSLIVPVMNKLYQLKHSKGDIYLNKGPNFEDGMWYSVVYMNAQTSLFMIDNQLI